MNQQNKYCIKKCNFMKFVEDDFKCSYYDTILEMHLSPSGSSIRPLRCKGCLQDGDKISTLQAISIIEMSVDTIDGHVRYLKEMISQLKGEQHENS